MTDPPPPDALLLELLDLLPLCFPTFPREAKVHFGPTDDGATIALTDLWAAADEGAPARPDLGFDDVELLDTINALLQELDQALRRAADLRLSRGRVEVRPRDEDGAVPLWIVESGQDPDDDRVRVKRLVDSSEQQLFVFTPALFARLHETLRAESALWERGQALTENAARFSLDTARGALAFFDDEGAQTSEHPAVLLGTYHAPTATFVWGHANEALPPALVRACDRVRLAGQRGLRALSTPELLCPHEMARRLCGTGGVVLGAEALTRLSLEGPEGPVSGYFALLDAAGTR